MDIFSAKDIVKKYDKHTALDGVSINVKKNSIFGLLGPNASTTIIDTSLYGDITIEITLAPSDVLMLSPTTPA
jgi:ABC-type multidrug transport system ATPase subunit